jgi:diketogulonate reductase-like aldo/keto reductase
MSTKQATATGLRTVTLPSGEEIPVLGVGTWGMAERAGHRLRRLNTDHLDLYLLQWRHSRTAGVEASMQASE